MSWSTLDLKSAAQVADPLLHRAQTEMARKGAHRIKSDPIVPYLQDDSVGSPAKDQVRLARAGMLDRVMQRFLSQVGQANADILLVPTEDWREIDPYHTQMTTFAAIETGSSLVTQADRGLSVAVDYEGHVLASTDFFTTVFQMLPHLLSVENASDPTGRHA